MSFSQLTFTRFIAAVLIVLYHFAANKPLIHQLGGLGRVVLIASTFVSYFFVLSGFILVVANAKAVRLQQFPSAANFWINRFARIYPLFFLAFLLSIPQFHEATGAYPTPQALLANVLLCQAWVPLRSFSINFPDWSLSCELFFYLLFPAILRTLMVLKTRIVAIAIACAYMLNCGCSRLVS